VSDIDKAIQEFIDTMDRLTISLQRPNMTVGFLQGRMINIIEEISEIGKIVQHQEERLKRIEDTNKS